jgi:hypothetical protein
LGVDINGGGGRGMDGVFLARGCSSWPWVVIFDADGAGLLAASRLIYFGF